MPLYQQIKEELETPNPEASANSVLLMQQIKNNPDMLSLLRNIYRPTDKFKAIKQFASLLGIPDERFVDFVTQQDNNV